MTRDEKITEAQRLVATGLNMAEIGRRLGVTRHTVNKWLHPDRAKRWDAASNAHRGPAKRAWENEHDRGYCACGTLLVVGARRKGTRACRECYLEQRQVEGAWRMQPVYELWHQGAPVKQIAATLATTPAAIQAAIHRMRREGWDMPYRRPAAG